MNVRIALVMLSLVLSSAAFAQRGTFSGTDEVFDFSRQAVVFTDLSLFGEVGALAWIDIDEASENSWLPYHMVAIGAAPPVDPTFRMKYSFLLLNALDYKGPVFGDRIASIGHLVEAGGVYRTNLDIGEWYPGGLDVEIGGGAEVLFSKLASTQTPNLDDDIGFTKPTSPFDYGSEWVGSTYVQARIGPFLRWQSKLRFQRRRSVDPGRVSLDGRGALVLGRDDRSGVKLSLFDRFEIAGIGLAGEVQHGDTAWNFKQMLMVGLREKFLIPDLGTTVEFGVKGFDGFETNLVELNVAYIDLPRADYVISGGGRLGFDGAPYSARFGIMYENFKVEGTLQLVNRYGETDRLLGFGVGLGGISRFFIEEPGPPPLDFELAVYYNYLDQLDQMPGLRGTVFVTGRALVQGF